MMGPDFLETASTASSEGGRQQERPRAQASWAAKQMHGVTAQQLLALRQQHCQERMRLSLQMLKLQEAQHQHLVQAQITHSADVRCMNRSLEIENAWQETVNELMITNQRHVQLIEAADKHQQQQQQQHQQQQMRQYFNYVEGFVSEHAGHQHNITHCESVRKSLENQPRKLFNDMEGFISKQVSDARHNDDRTQHDASESYISSELGTVSGDGFSEALLDSFSGGQLETNRAATSLMVRNIPIRYTQEMLLKEWPNSGEYDFLYLPIHIKKRCNNSFCFINFVSPEAAQDFARTWQNKKLQCYSSRKPLDISLAVVQGRRENLMRCKCNKTMRLNNLHFLPAVFEGSRRIDFRELLDIMAKAAGSNDQASDCEAVKSSFPELCEGAWMTV